MKTVMLFTNRFGKTNKGRSQLQVGENLTKLTYQDKGQYILCSKILFSRKPSVVIIIMCKKGTFTLRVVNRAETDTK